MPQRYQHPPTGSNEQDIMKYRMKLIEEVRQREADKKKGMVVPYVDLEESSQKRFPLSIYWEKTQIVQQ